VKKFNLILEVNQMEQAEFIVIFAWGMITGIAVTIATLCIFKIK